MKWWEGTGLAFVFEDRSLRLGQEVRDTGGLIRSNPFRPEVSPRGRMADHWRLVDHHISVV